MYTFICSDEEAIPVPETLKATVIPIADVGKDEHSSDGAHAGAGTTRPSLDREESILEQVGRSNANLKSWGVVSELRP